ncbi:RNA polymerase sigma factor [Novipirellula artificiosorum]|nr:sigma-70 family RNA polymerase sigma factor [Novipirellula artificiosorum]
MMQSHATNTIEPASEGLVSTRTDSQLIQVVLQGDSTAYDELVRRYQERLYTSIWSNVGCPALAEDIVQDAFLNAYIHLRSFRNRSSFYTWLYRIALNSRRNYLHKRGHAVSIEFVDEDQSRDRSARHETPVDCAERQEDRIHVRVALSRLDDAHRTILMLREFEGFDYETIAEMLQVKMGTVRSRLSRARAKLKQELDNYLTAGSESLQSDYGHDPNALLNQ